MTNQEVYDLCQEKITEILQEINTTPPGWQLWLMVENDQITWTTQSQSTRAIVPVFARYGHQREKLTAESFQDELWRCLYNSRGDN